MGKKFEKIDQILKETVDSGFVHGNSAMVLKDGEEIYFGSYGTANYEKQIPFKRDTIVRLYSMTKPITAAAVMTLIEKGKLALTDPVSKFLPEYAHQKVYLEDGSLVDAERDLQIFDLLTMTSGIPYGEEWSKSGREMAALFDQLIAAREKGERVDTQTYAKEIAKVPLLFQPGERWQYGLSADVLGAVVEKVTGMSYREYLKEAIFEPLSMKDTDFCVPKDQLSRFATNYEWVDGNGLIPYTKSFLGEYYREDVAFCSGGAGLVSTIDDYSHFACMMACGGVFEGKRILQEESIRFLATDQLSDSQKCSFNWDSLVGYGYGGLMRVLLDQKASGAKTPIGEFGWDSWTGSYVAMVPKDYTVILYMTQRCNAGTTQAATAIRDEVYSEK